MLYVLYTHTYTHGGVPVCIYIYIYMRQWRRKETRRERERARATAERRRGEDARARARRRERERGSKRGALAATLLPPAAAAAAAVLLPPALNYAGLLSTPGGPASRAHLARRSACAVPVCPCSLESLSVCTYYIRALLCPPVRLCARLCVCMLCCRPLNTRARARVRKQLTTPGASQAAAELFQTAGLSTAFSGGHRRSNFWRESDNSDAVRPRGVRGEDMDL